MPNEIYLMHFIPEVYVTKGNKDHHKNQSRYKLILAMIPDEVRAPLLLTDDLYLSEESDLDF